MTVLDATTFKKVIALRNFVMMSIFFCCAYIADELHYSIWLGLLVFFIHSIRLLLNKGEWIRCSRSTYYFIAIIFLLIALVEVLKHHYTYIPFYVANILFYVGYAHRISLNVDPVFLIKKV